MFGRQIGKEENMRGDSVVWTIVGILLIVVLIIWLLGARV
jgi:hypothetical protein